MQKELKDLLDRHTVNAKKKTHEKWPLIGPNFNPLLFFNFWRHTTFSILIIVFGMIGGLFVISTRIFYMDTITIDEHLLLAAATSAPLLLLLLRNLLWAMQVYKPWKIVADFLNATAFKSPKLSVDIMLPGPQLVAAVVFVVVGQIKSHARSIAHHNNNKCQCPSRPPHNNKVHYNPSTIPGTLHWRRQRLQRNEFTGETPLENLPRKDFNITANGQLIW